METELLAAFEKELDPAHPEGGRFGCRVLACGELATLLCLEAWPGRVLKRVAGFASGPAASAYLDALARYHAALEKEGLPVAETETAAVTARSGRAVAYLVQPRSPAEVLAPAWLAAGAEPAVDELVGRVLEQAARLLRSNRQRTDDLQVAIQARLADFAWEGPGSEPILLDPGVPLLRCGGALAFDCDLLRSGQGGLQRRRLRRRGAEERALLACFRLDRALLHVLASFPGVASEERFQRAILFVADWLSAQPEAGEVRAPDAVRVRALVEREAAARRADLAARRRARLRARLLLRPYDWILPSV